MISHRRVLWYCALLALMGAELMGAARIKESYLAVPWDSEEGLPHNAVYRIAQSREGYLVAATSAGLAQFDGLQFHRIDSPLLRNKQTDSVRQMAVDAAGRVLVAPGSGGLFTIFEGEVAAHPANAALANERIAGLFPMPDGRLWVSLFGGILVSWKDGELSRVGRLHTAGSGRISMTDDARGNLWIAVGNFVGVWKEGKFERQLVSLKPNYHLARAREGVWIAGEDGVVLLREGREEQGARWSGEMSQVSVIFEQSSGELWAGTTDTGLFRRSEDRFVRGPLTHPEISCLIEDREGNLWAGTAGGGIYMVRRQYVTVFDARAGLPQDISFSICEGPDGAVWFANRSGGLMRWKDDVFTAQAAVRRGLPGATVVNVTGKGSVYMGTDLGLFWFPTGFDSEAREASVFRARALRCLYTSRADELWVATRTRFGRMRETDFAEAHLEKPEESFVSAVAEDSKGRIVAGTSGGELFRQAGESFEKLHLPDEMGLINAIAPHEDGSIWLGLAGGGLVCWRDGVARVFTEGNGPPDNVVTQLVWEDAEVLWGGSRSGIWRVTLGELERASKNGEKVYPLTLGKSDGAPGGSCMGSQQPVCFKGRDGALWFATRRGVVRVNPAGFRARPQMIPTLLERFTVDGKAFSTKTPEPAPARSGTFLIRFNALSLAAADRLRFRYRLDGYDSEWVDAGTSREAEYRKLPPAHYVFYAQARDPHGGWLKNGPTLAFEVLPAWWQKGWVQAGIGLSVAGLLAAAVRYLVARGYQQQLETIKRRQAVEAERARIARDLHDEMGAGLTHLTHLGHVNEGHGTEQLRESLDRVARRARELSVQMDAIVWTVNPKNDSLDQLGAYLSHFGEEMFRDSETRLRVDRPQELPKLAITPEFRHHVLMIVKEALNNVAKHAHAPEAWLRLRVEGGELRVEIEDSGRGLESKAIDGEGEGLLNMQGRARELGGSMEFVRGEKNGTLVRLRVPLRREL